mgnify:CR=1 FL=1
MIFGVAFVFCDPHGKVYTIDSDQYQTGNDYYLLRKQGSSRKQQTLHPHRIYNETGTEAGYETSDTHDQIYERNTDDGYAQYPYKAYDLEILSQSNGKKLAAFNILIVEELEKPLEVI